VKGPQGDDYSLSTDLPVEDESVIIYVNELQQFVNDTKNRVDRYNREKKEQMSKVTNLEAYLDGKTDVMTWNPFDSVNFLQPPPSPTLSAPRLRPPDDVIDCESDEVKSYILDLEGQGEALSEEAETLKEDTRMFVDLVEQLNREVLDLHERTEEEGNSPQQPKRKRKRFSFLRRRPKPNLTWFLNKLR